MYVFSTRKESQDVVAAAAKLAESPKAAMMFSNDCRWLGEQVRRVAERRNVPAVTGEKLREAAEIFELLAESWYDDTLVSVPRDRRRIQILIRCPVRTGTQDQRDP